MAATASAQEDPAAVPDLGAPFDPLAVPDLAAPEPAPELKSLAETCSAHKFETVVKIEGRNRGSHVRICGEPGQSDSDWLNTLRSSITQTEANDALSAAVKAQIVAALKAEIGRLQFAASGTTTTTTTAISLPKETIAAREPAPEYTSLPPLPTPRRTAQGGAGGKALPAAAPVVAPRLTIRCALPRESFGSCASLRRETQLLIRADEAVAGGTSIRFLRGGDERAELDLGPLKEGDSMREELPARVCSGVLRGKVQVQVMVKRQVARTLGPYALYCGS